METEQEDSLPDGGSTTSLTGVGARFLPQSIWQWTEYNGMRRLMMLLLASTAHLGY